MKANIESLTGNIIIRDIDTAESPADIICKLYEDDATAAIRIVASRCVIDQLMDGHIDEAHSAFELFNLEGDTIRADWMMPLCNQLSIMEELANIEAAGQMPTFVVGFSCLTA